MLLPEPTRSSDVSSLIASSSAAVAATGTLLPSASTTLRSHFRLRKSVVVNRQVPDVVAFVIEPADRLLEEVRHRITGGHRALDDVQLVLVHVDCGRRA